MAQLIRPYNGDPHEFFEVVMLADQYGNLVGPSNPSGMAVDAFGRARGSHPYTIFDSFHRFRDNGKASEKLSATGATSTYNSNSSSIDLTLDTANGSYAYRESNRAFPYQPGKSLQILQTFVMNTPKANLRQRFGYFNGDNGIFLQVDGTEISFVIRSKVSGVVVEDKVTQTNWNMDKVDGTGYSGVTLDISKAQILFMDIEWLGVGSVRMGFVINGQFLHCHTFHHANSVTAPYMGTACLPVRCEIENTGVTASSSTLKVICTSVISEGGFEPKGQIRTAGLPLGSPKDIPTAGTFVPIISIRLQDTYPDAIAFIRSIQFFGATNNTNYRYKLVSGATLTGASWTQVADSAIEYDITATAMSGGIDRRIEYVNVAAGSGAQVSQIDPSDMFKFQLERNPFAVSDKGTIFTLCATGASNGNDALGAIQWEEVT